MCVCVCGMHMDIWLDGWLLMVVFSARGCFYNEIVGLRFSSFFLDIFFCLALVCIRLSLCFLFQIRQFHCQNERVLRLLVYSYYLHRMQKFIVWRVCVLCNLIKWFMWDVSRFWQKVIALLWNVHARRNSLIEVTCNSVWS